MIDYYKNNEGYLLNMEPKKYFNIIICIYIIIFYLLIFSFTYKVTDYEKVKLIVSCDNKCQYFLYSNIDNLKNITKYNKIKIEKNDYPYKIKKIGEINYNEMANQNYQLVEIKINLEKKYQINNLYLDAKIKLKEEKLIKKIKRIVFEGA